MAGVVEANVTVSPDVANAVRLDEPNIMPLLGATKLMVCVV